MGRQARRHAEGGKRRRCRHLRQDAAGGRRRQIAAMDDEMAAAILSKLKPARRAPFSTRWKRSGPRKLAILIAGAAAAEKKS